MKIAFKLIIITILFFSITTNASARKKWSTGIRTGIGLRHVNLTTEYDLKPINKKWQNQVFLTRTIGKKYELEIGLSYSQKTYKSEYQDRTTGNITYYSQKEICINPAVVIRYYAVLYKKFSFYNQLGIEFMEPIVKSTSVTYYPNRPPKVSSDKYQSWPGPSTIFIGIGSNYTLSKKLYLTGQANLIYKSGYSTINGPDQVSDLSAISSIGIGYRF